MIGGRGFLEGSPFFASPTRGLVENTSAMGDVTGLRCSVGRTGTGGGMKAFINDGVVERDEG
jgi:hypothetical protein